MTTETTPPPSSPNDDAYRPAADRDPSKPRRLDSDPNGPISPPFTTVKPNASSRLSADLGPRETPPPSAPAPAAEAAATLAPALAADRARTAIGGILTYGFGTAVAMWVTGYALHIPVASGSATSDLAEGVFIALMAILAGGAFLAGRTMRPGWQAGLGSGLVTSLLNLIVLSSLLGGDNPEEMRTNMMPLVAGSVGIGAVLGLWFGWLGGFYARPVRPDRVIVADQGDRQPRNWRGPFAAVAAMAVLSLVALGGVVTGTEEGLSVPDWPATEGYTMIFYPLSKMTGGIYYEHTHRLFAVLVGLVTAVIGFWVLFRDRRRWLKGLGVAVMVLVIAQAVLGGIRVTASPDAGANASQWASSAQARGGLSTQDIDMLFAIAHGTLAQAFFGLMLLLAAATTTRWRDANQPARPTEGGGFGRKWGVMLIGVLLVQILLGAVLRHLGQDAVGGILHLHISLGILGAIGAIILGMNALARFREIPTLHRLGRYLLIAACLIVPLGFAAWGARGGQVNTGDPQAIEVVLTTAHQLLGATTIGLTVLLTAWTYRLTTPPIKPAPTP